MHSQEPGPEISVVDRAPHKAEVAAELFEAQAERTPHAVAIVHGDQRLTYAELNARANQLAHHLRTLGVKPDARVAISVERSPEMIVASLGVLKAGGAYVPLDPTYPEHRLRYMLEDSAPAALLTEASVAAKVDALTAGLNLPVIELDTAAEAWAGLPETNPDRLGVGLRSDHLAYVVYTSGSTGRPKGVMVEQRGVCNLVQAQFREIPVESGSRILQFASFSFDAFAFEMAMALCRGAALHLPPRGTVLLGEALVQAIADDGITHVTLPPAVLVTVPEGAGLESVSTLVLAGDVVTEAAVKRWAPGRRLLNAYGPTESTVWATLHECRSDETGNPCIGLPIANTRIYVLGVAAEPVPPGVVGEMYIGGAGVARGYLNRPGLTAERFVPDPFSDDPDARLFRTGDRGRWRTDGRLEFLGRNDFQVKVRGFRVEPGEIEAQLTEHSAVREAVVLARGDGRLAAYYVAVKPVEAKELRAHLSERLPDYMVPSLYLRLETMPLTPNRKLDRKGLLALTQTVAKAAYVAPRLPLEETVAGIWGEVLGLERVGARENFFDLGGHSHLLPGVQVRLQETLGREVPMLDLLRFPTVAALAARLSDGEPPRVHEASTADTTRARGDTGHRGGAFAVIGMAGRFPGAPDVEQFWSNLRDGVHSITFSGEQELAAAGTDPSLLRDPAYIRARGILEGIDLFDAAFFGFNPREAEILDPQQRIFLETAWEALENAGYGPGSTPQTVGIYAGSSASDYLTRHVLTHPEVLAAVGTAQMRIGNGTDFLVSRAAYKLNLRGPALAVQTACSTGLVAVHVACQALAAGECDLAVAGGVGIRPGRGYLYSPGGIMSPDGYCRAFDARAAGTVGGDGIGLVVLKRLDDAVADRDTIRAVVRGSAVNNDGAQKVGFTAPSVDAQAEVVARALAQAGADPETVGFVEAHGSGTRLGDPVEVAALTQAFGSTRRTEYCALGSVKTNIGHLDAAAGVAGLIKAILAVEHGEVPPTLHYTEPNPQINFAASPFFVNTELRPWPGVGPTPRRAGVSSLGMGGTNAHVILEEAPPRQPSAPERSWHLVTLSARTPAALEAATDRLAAYLRAHPEEALGDVAYTLQVGRQSFEHRRVLVARDAEDAARALETRAPDRIFDAAAQEKARRVAFIFPGLGNHHSGMGRGVYESEPVFREVVDRCAEILRPHLGADVREVLYGDDAWAPDGAAIGTDLRALLGRAERDESANRLLGTRMAQVALFVTEYALARLWMQWGVLPEAMVGHSLGEYVAATVAGVWSLEDALMLVAERARLIEELPEGGMMGLPFTKEEVAPFLRDGLCIGAQNGPAASIVSGPVAAVDALQAEMTMRGVALRRLPTRHAFHSWMMAPVAARLARLLRGIHLHPPRIPFASNVTGNWITAEDATDPEYWTRHLCRTVRFSEGVETLARSGIGTLLELGPGNTLGWLAVRLAAWGDHRPPLVVSLRHPYERHPDAAFLSGAAGRLWAAGAAVDWKAVHAHERLRRIPIPTYPFERGRFWLEPRAFATPEVGRGDPLAKKPDPADWLYVPTWARAPLVARAAAPSAVWLVLADKAGIGGRLAGRLETLGHTVVVAEEGECFARVGDRAYTLRAGSAGDWAALRDALQAAGTHPRRVVHLWGIGREDERSADAFARAQARGFLTVGALPETFARDLSEPLHLIVVTEGVRDVVGGETVHPERATVLGACLTLPHTYLHVTCRTVDVRSGAGGLDRLVDQLAAEVATDSADTTVALRGPWRWVLGYEAVRPREGATGLRAGGGYLFSGGMTGGAEVLAEHLAGTLGAHVAVVVDPGFPEREEWDSWRASAAAPTLRALRAIESRGGRILLLRAAPGDAPALRAAVTAAREAFGALHGVIHTPVFDTGGENSALPEARFFADATGLARATRELAALENATAGFQLDFRLLQNSIFSVFGGAGPVSTAAFVLVDAWAQRGAGEGARWTSVSWDRWDLEGGDAAPAGAFAERAILRGDGARMFACLAALAEEPRVVVSTHDLNARLQRFHAPKSASARPAEVDVTNPGLHPRPVLGNEYLVPTGDAQRILAGIWSDQLGIRDIGVRDSFFELGGHSLLGIRLLSRVREAFGVELPLRAIFEAPTIAGLAELVDEAIIQALDGMSEEEAESALAFLPSGLNVAPVVRG